MWSLRRPTSQPAVQRFEHPAAPRASAGANSAAGSGTLRGRPGTAPSGATPGASSAGPAAGAGSRPRATARNVYDWSAWRALARGTSLPLEAPTVWAPNLGYDTAGVPFRAYSVQTPAGHRVRAAIAVGTVAGPSGSEYWGVQALRWKDPPAIADPTRTQTVGGRTYRLFYQDSALHMVAWQENGCTYWVSNTLDNVLSNQLMLRLARSCAPIG